MTTWTDFMLMVEDILTYTRRTGVKVVVADNPLGRQVGFMAVPEGQTVESSEGPLWVIDVTDLLKTLPPIPAHNDTVRMLLRSAEGREKMASGFSRGLKVWE